MSEEEKGRLGLPWQFKDSDVKGRSFVLNVGKELIAYSDGHADVMEFMIKSVNAHHALVEACEFTVKEWDRVKKPGEADPLSVQGMRLAMAKAKGEIQ